MRLDVEWERVQGDCNIFLSKNLEAQCGVEEEGQLADQPRTSEDRSD